MSEPVYEKKEQLERLLAGLLPGEEVQAVLDMASPSRSRSGSEAD